MSELVFYVPGQRHAQDSMIPDGSRGAWSRKTLAELQAEHPTGVVITSDDAAERIEALCITKPERITRERFEDLRDVLPPLNWRGVGACVESFALSEFTNGRVTRVCVRVGRGELATFWSWEDVASLSQSELLAKLPRGDQ